MNNKTFKRVVALVASALMLCSCAFAATIGDVTYDIATGKITVNYEAAEGASKAAIMVTKADGTIVAVNQHDGVKTAFNETLDITKVAANDVLTIKVGDNAAASTEAASTTFTVVEPVVEYTVTFMNGEVAYATVPNVVAGRAVAEILPETAPTKDATAEKVYTFAGWYTDAELTTALAADATVAADLTLYAKFDEAARTYTITYVVDDVTTTETLAYGAVPAPADPVKEGYTFTGWNPALAAVAGDATYTATFEAIIPDAPAVKVTFVNGAESTVVEAVDGKVTAPADTVFDKTVNAGYTLTLDSWVTADEGTSYAKGEAIEVNADLTLYAKYLCDRPIGDVNNDGVVNNTDGNAIKYFMVGQRANRQYNVNKPLYEGATILIGDVNNDNVVNNTDGNAIKYFMVGQRANRQYNVNKPLYVINK